MPCSVLLNNLFYVLVYFTFRDKYDLVNEKESRKSHLNSVSHNHSRDSAIDADLQEFETETIDIELVSMP